LFFQLQSFQLQFALQKGALHGASVGRYTPFGRLECGSIEENCSLTMEELLHFVGFPQLDDEQLLEQYLSASLIKK
jgi:hypothetical protein